MSIMDNDFLRSTIEGMNTVATSAFREGRADAKRELKLKVRALNKSDPHLFAGQLMQLVGDWVNEP